MVKHYLLVSLATVLLFFGLLALSAAIGAEFGLNLLLVIGAISLAVVAVASRYVFPRRASERA